MAACVVLAGRGFARATSRLVGAAARQLYTLHKLVTAFERMSEALHFAHEKGLVHRDIKPDSVMLGEFGEVHVMDWGIAKVAATGGADDTDLAADAVHTVETDTEQLTQIARARRASDA